MAYNAPDSRFKEDNYHVHSISEDQLTLCGGGDFYSGDEEVDDETWGIALGLAEKYGMEIIDGKGQWYGWSECTPDPGDVSVFNWQKKATL